MKKNLFSDNESSKGSKGFYAALGISALMIGSACFFAYDQGEKISENNDIIAENSIAEEAVDKKSSDVPKLTTAYTTTQTSRPVTESVIIPNTIATLPAAAIATDAVTTTIVTETTATTLTIPAKLESPHAPLADMSKIITPFSGKELVKNETTGSWQTHNGIDIAGEVGTDVYAVSSGEVTAVNEDPLWGITVVVDHHNGYVSRYCGLAKELSVQKGDNVTGGSLLGVIGNTADIESSLEPHLHFEIMHNGAYTSPEAIINS